MFKKILIGVLAAVVIVAIGASAYSAFAASANSTASPLAALGFGQGGQGQGRQGGGGKGTGSGVPNPQANISGQTTVHGVVSAVSLTTVTIAADDGSSHAVQLGNSYYVKSIGFAPQVGETLTILGFPGDQGLYSAITITSDKTGTVYAFRDPATGRPMWAGGQDKDSGQGQGQGNGKP